MTGRASPAQTLRDSSPPPPESPRLHGRIPLRVDLRVLPTSAPSAYPASSECPIRPMSLRASPLRAPPSAHPASSACPVRPMSLRAPPSAHPVSSVCPVRPMSLRTPHSAYPVPPTAHHVPYPSLRVPTPPYPAPPRTPPLPAPLRRPSSVALGVLRVFHAPPCRRLLRDSWPLRVLRVLRAPGPLRALRILSTPCTPPRPLGPSELPGSSAPSDVNPSPLLPRPPPTPRRRRPFPYATKDRSSLRFGGWSIGQVCIPLGRHSSRGCPGSITRPVQDFSSVFFRDLRPSLTGSACRCDRR